MNVDFVKQCLKSVKLEHLGRYIFTNKQINQFINYNLTGQKVDYGKSSNLTKVFEKISPIELTSHKKTMLVNHKEQFFSTNDSNELIMSNEFVQYILIEYAKQLELNKLSSEEIDDINQGFVFLSPTISYSKFSQKFDRTFGKIQFDESKVQVKNIKGFHEPKSKFDMQHSMDTPKKFYVSIEEEISSTPIVKHIMFQTETDNGTYTLYNYETNLMNKSKGVLPDNCYDDEEEKIPVSAIMNFHKASVMYYAYKAKVYFDDDLDNPIELTVESFSKLRQTYYNAYGYCRVGTKSKILHLKIYHAEEEKSSNIVRTDIFDDSNKTHKFFQYYEFVFNYVKSKGIKMNKRQSDTLLWMEDLKTIIQFSGLDKDREAHSIYAGFQDIGKSYIVNIMRYMKFASSKIASPSNMTMAGLFGASNSVLHLPDEDIANTVQKGAFGYDLVIMEEIGKAIRDKNTLFHTGLEDFKLALYEDTVDLLKYGGGTVDRNAYAILTMNYDTEWTEILRKELDKIATETEKDIEKQKIVFGEQDTDLFSEGSKVRSSALRELVSKYDIFLPLEDYPTETFKFGKIEISELEALAFKKSIEKFRERYISKDIHTGLPYSFLKRTMFSLYGTTNETKKDEEKLTKKVENSFSKKSAKQNDLYIPNLRQIVNEEIESKALANGYNEKANNIRLNFIADTIVRRLFEKYPSINLRFGAATPNDIGKKVLLSLQFLNDEFKFPGIDSMQLTEKWAYLQVNPITSNEASNFKNFEKRMSYLVNKKNYEQFKEEVLEEWRKTK